MIVGFSGTRDGMTHQQDCSVRGWLGQYTTSAFRQGCCIGADEQAAAIVAAMKSVPIYGHPSTLYRMTSAKALKLCSVVHHRMEPIDRNHVIVDHSDILLAAPGSFVEEWSGTWSSIRWAIKTLKPIRIFWPDGKTTYGNALRQLVYGGSGSLG